MYLINNKGKKEQDYLNKYLDQVNRYGCSFTLI